MPDTKARDNVDEFSVPVVEGGIFCDGSLVKQRLKYTSTRVDGHSEACVFEKFLARFDPEYVGGDDRVLEAGPNADGLGGRPQHGYSRWLAVSSPSACWHWHPHFGPWAWARVRWRRRRRPGNPAGIGIASASFCAGPPHWFCAPGCCFGIHVEPPC